MAIDNKCPIVMHKKCSTIKNTEMGQNFLQSGELPLSFIKAHYV
jgi:hypothetical protein